MSRKKSCHMSFYNLVLQPPVSETHANTNKGHVFRAHGSKLAVSASAAWKCRDSMETNIQDCTIMRVWL